MSVTSTTTVSGFANSLGRSILSGGSATGKGRSSISDASSLANANLSAILSLGTSSGSKTGSSPLLANGTDLTSYHNALTAAILGKDNALSGVAEAAALGSTLDAMAKAAQSALSSLNTTDRTKALATYKSLYDQLNSSTVSLNGLAENAASLGLSAPGNWANSDLQAGTQAIAKDMAAVVRAHASVSSMTHVNSATLIASLFLDQ